MTNAVRLSEAARGVLMSSMSDAGCAMTLGRSAAWVARMRLALTEPSRAEPSRAEPSRAEPSRAEGRPAAAPGQEVSTPAGPDGAMGRLVSCCGMVAARDCGTVQSGPGAGVAMTAADRAEEALRDELDMLCMPQPSSLQIAAVRQAAEACHVA